MAFNDFFLTDVAYATKHAGGLFAHDANLLMGMNFADPNDAFGHLAVGSLAIVGPNGKLILTVLDPLLPTYEYVKIMVGRGNTELPWISGNIYRDVVSSYGVPTALKNYFAIIGKSGAIGDLNLPATLVAGTSVGVTIKFTQNQTALLNDSHTYTDVVVAGDTAITIIDRLVALINKESQFAVTATNEADVGLGIEVDRPAALVAFGAFENASIIDASNFPAVAINAKISEFEPGANNVDDVTYLEKKAFADRGMSDGASPEQYQTWKIKSRLLGTESYNVYTLEWGLSPIQIGEAISSVAKPSLCLASLVGSGGVVGITTEVDQVMIAVFGAQLAI